MTTFSLSHLVSGPLSLDLSKADSGSPSQVSAFNDALARQGAASDVSAITPLPAGAPASSPDALSSSRDASDPGVAERERVRRSLDLEGAAAGATTGDSILGGLSRLRGVFDARQHRITDLMRTDMGTTQSLLAMQMEIAQYSVMIDVSSKLTGKAASTLDTLMKGQ